MHIKVPKYRACVYDPSKEKVIMLDVLRIDFEKQQVIAVNEEKDRYYYDFKALKGLDQNTGVRDDKFKPIYEGDIVEFKNPSLIGRKHFIGVVEYEAGEYMIVDREKRIHTRLFHETAELTLLGDKYNDKIVD